MRCEAPPSILLKSSAPREQLAGFLEPLDLGIEKYQYIRSVHQIVLRKN
jgi:hypothetical protein